MKKTVNHKRWTPEELEEAFRRYPHEDTNDIAADLGRSQKSVYHRCLKAGVYKSPEYIANKRRQDAKRLTGNGKGPWNKGKRYPSTGRALETQFKKGNVPSNWLPVGSERVNKDGDVERKVAEPKYWRPVKDLIWEEHNGPIPAGHFVFYRDRNMSNKAPENLVCMTRAENMRRNSLSKNYPPEVVSTIRQLDYLNRRIKETSK